MCRVRSWVSRRREQVRKPNGQRLLAVAVHVSADLVRSPLRRVSRQMRHIGRWPFAAFHIYLRVASNPLGICIDAAEVSAL
jgi:hypothetical protein